MKKEWVTYCLRLLVLLVLTCNRGEVFAATEKLTGPYSLSSDKTVNKKDTLVINGDLTIPNNKTLTISENAVLRVKGNLTIEKKGTLVLKSQSQLLVAGNLTQNGSGLWSVTTGNLNSMGGAFIVVEGNYSIYYSTGLTGLLDVYDDGGYPDPSTNTIYVFGANDLSYVGVSTTPKTISDFQDDYHVTSISGFLPIELTSFTVSATEYGYTFNWVTASEVENDYFTLEFSENGEKFIAIDYVSGAGTTSETTEYEYVWDAKPTADILYFRLKQTDYNGEFTYSDILVYAPKKSHGANRILYYGPLKLNVVDGQLQYIVE